MDRWNQIINSSNDSKIYHLEQWGTLINKIHGHKLVYLEEEKGIFPLALVKSFIFGNRLISLPFANYGGPCGGDEKITEKLILEAENEAKRLKVDFMEIRSPGEKYFNIFRKQSFIERNDYFTFILDLNKSLEMLWRELELKTRNMIGRARKGGVKIVFGENESDLRKFYKLYLKTMKRLGSPPQPYRFFETIWNLFYPKNLFVPMAIYNSEVIASGLFFLHKDTIHHAYSCSSKKDFQPGTNNLIIWQVIEWGKNNGFKYLDFGRTREGAGNVLFKKGWGGRLIRRPYFYKFYRKRLKQRQEIKYKELSALWAKYLPEFIANKIGPWLIKQIG